MKDYQQQFIEFAFSANAFQFGQFTLKSGRNSPYFLNTGVFSTGQQLARLGQFYAMAIVGAQLEYDMLFGPAYKGIPLVVSTSVALAEKHQQDKPVCFNRKEIKDHGEGGLTVGAALRGKVLVIDDVITAGTALRQSVEIIQQHNAQFAGVVVSFDRQERGQARLSAIQEVQQQYKVPVVTIATLDNLLTFLSNEQKFSQIIDEIIAYQQLYAVKSS
jgi:orotate phosphoribosyltransferase